MPLISYIHAREILDSRGNPTVEVEVKLCDGALGRAAVPSGASTGTAEALELRDGDPRRYCGRGVQRAVSNVNREIASSLLGMDFSSPKEIDDHLNKLDGTDGKKRLGANAILGTSLAVARAAADSAGIPLYRYLGGDTATTIPVPMVNILSGGLHADGNIDFQDFLMIPLRAGTYAEALEHAVVVYRVMKDVLISRNVFRAGVADEGGYAPALKRNEQGFELMVEAFTRAGFKPGRDVAIAVDVAASHFWNGRTYKLAAEGVELDSAELVERLVRCAGAFPILSIEDGLGEEDWFGWKLLSERLGNRCQLVGDDIFVTNPTRLDRGIQENVANAVLVKMNQIGTLSETLEVARMAQRHGYRTVVSARSGETEDDSMADLAVAVGNSQIKIGSVSRSERLVKYNRLLRIEEELGFSASYHGGRLFKGSV